MQIKIKLLIKKEIMVARSISKYQQITINKNKKYKEDTMRRSDREIKDELHYGIRKCNGTRSDSVC